MSPMTDTLHKKAIELYNKYICIGGMPASILHYLDCDKDISKYDDNILNMLIMAYLADMAKYTENIESIRNAKIYNSIPAQLGKDNKKFKYSLVEKSARAREYDSAMEWLVSSNMILKSKGIVTPKSPLKSHVESNFKIYLSDIGMLRVLSKISINEIITEKNMIYKGVFVENYIAEELFSKYRELYYWSIDNMYEVDFLINVDGDIIPIEVKASDNTTSKSLNYYINRYKPKYSIRLSTRNFGEANGIKSIPLYASFSI